MSLPRRPPPRRLGSSRRGAGYTIVEVMMAMAVLAIGATGIVAMQKATLLGNTHARDLATAGSVATAWIERLKVDALRWRRTGTGDTVDQTSYLYVVLNDYPTISTNEGKWIRPAPSGAMGYSPMADVRGADTTNAALAGFCTNIRVTQVLRNLIRAEVRVFWLKNKGTSTSNQVGHAGTIGGGPLCPDDAAYMQQVSSAGDRYHFVYLTTAILRNES